MTDKRWLELGTTTNLKILAIMVGLLSPALSPAQSPCKAGVQIVGVVTDQTGAVIPGAKVQAAKDVATTTDTTGRFVLSCVPARSTVITATADGFAAATSNVNKRSGEIAHLYLKLTIASLNTDVQVGPDLTGIDADRGSGTSVMNASDLVQLADDPDDFLRQLQVLASTGGGPPESAVIVVDGFQNGSALPPKNSIAAIRINPDEFLAEYQSPPWYGGRIEITTKPGADKFHGAIFSTDSDGSFSATDPFSVTATHAGKRRYGFELGGPIVPKKSGFAVALEKRDIDEFNVVNALTLDDSRNLVPLQQTVAAPQRLWIASARGDWQVTPKNVAALSFSANNNSLGNQGVGGLTLADAGYSSLTNEYDLRFTNSQILTPNLLHNSRIGYSWKRTEQTPNSTAPALQVAGYFIDGGATSQDLNNRERDLEIDDGILFNCGKHTAKLGAQSLGIFIHDYDPNTFNGAFVFGGGSAPFLDANNNPTGETTSITAIEQYRRALANLPGGAPTTYQVTTGTPLIPFTQWRLALYTEDTIKLASHFTLVVGLRYQFQTSPGTFTNFAPRLGMSWAPGKKQSWVFQGRIGIFNDPINPSDTTEVYQLGGATQRRSTVYSPNYNNPLTPVPGSITVGQTNKFASSIGQNPWLQARIAVEHDFPHHWHPQAAYYWGSDWGGSRIVNINAPIVASNIGLPPDPTAALGAPRPLEQNQNILQYQHSGHLSGGFLFIGLAQNSYKRFGLHASFVHMNVKSDYGGTVGPQSSYSNHGESSRVSWERRNALTMFGNINLPYKFVVSTVFDAQSGRPYNVVTGTDNNGDGSFNDRPTYASAPGPGVYRTPFGLLTANTINGNVPRNLGTMPDLIHLDLNLSRAFLLNPKDVDHPRTLTFNARSANLLNHTNATAVSTVISSPTFGQSLSAETARRIELGIRIAF